MAPEQMVGGPIDPRTDIYALGVLLFQVLTGRLPFRVGSAPEIEEMPLSGPIPKVRDIVSVPPALDDVVARCMAKKREERYASVDELLRELRDAVAGRQTVSADEALERSAIGLYFVARIAEGHESDDAVLDDLERVLDLAHERCGAADMHVALDGASDALFVAKLP